VTYDEFNNFLIAYIVIVGFWKFKTRLLGQKKASAFGDEV
jgi:hypothetical protein